VESSWAFSEDEQIWPGRHAMRLLGGGHRYEAYVAWDDDLFCPVVVKILRPDQTDEPASLNVLANEARLLDRLAHPNLVRKFDAIVNGDRPHLVLELVEGPRLSTLIRRYGLAIEQVLSLGLSLASVLHYLTTTRTVHLDLKPRNIIMSGPPRLIDLSVARTLDQLAAITSPVGTDAYMAPEQCDPERFCQIGPPADVWGLGVTLHEATTGRSAFTKPDETARGTDRYPQLVEQPAPLDRDTPPELAQLLLSCLANNPDDRPTAAEVATTLEPIVAALPKPRLGRFRPGSSPRQPITPAH
jgi:eukaryotic-like serine/threonine-protein kinase